MKKIFILSFILCLFSLLAGAQQTKKLTVLFTSDVHSRVYPMPDSKGEKYAKLGGYERRAAIIEQFRKEDPELMLFDCGDFSQGTPYYNFYKGEIEVKLFNMLGYDAVAIGNHEFDFGMDNLARLAAMGNFPLLCANYDVSTTTLQPYVKPYIVLERKGVRIGVFGLGAKLEGLVQAHNCEGVVYTDPVEVSEKIAAQLREQEGCDLIICMSHLGVFEDERLAKSSSDVDLILGGHTHTFMNKPYYCMDKSGKPLPIMHTGKNGIYVGKLELTVKQK